MYKRAFIKSPFSYFLFGPRGTGKSTLLLNEYKNALYINLLKSNEFRDLLRSPSLLGDWINGAQKKQIIIDEIQKLPLLLDEVQNLMLSHPDLQFILSGSSARKLKKEGANLLAGRARTRELYTLTSHELNHDFNLDEILRFGSLPELFKLNTEADKIDYLDSYVNTYLNEEIKQEAVVRSLEPFVRFLEVSSILNGQIWNCSNVSREVGVARTSVEGYLSVLADTLIGFRLEACALKLKVKERANSKYYYFDPGVVRSLANRLRRPIESTEIGFLFETFLLNEMRAYSSYHLKKIQFSYWEASSSSEVDFILFDGESYTGIELKADTRWHTKYSKGLKELIEHKKIKRGFGIYRGEKELLQDGIHIFPVEIFLKKLWQNDFF